MGKHFGELGVHLRGILYYNLSPHEQRKYPLHSTLESLKNCMSRFRQTYLRWIPCFIGGYVAYLYIESSHYWLGRKDVRDYSKEVPPPGLERWCYKFEEPRGKCPDDWVVEKYICAPSEEPDPEMINFLEKRVIQVIDREAWKAADEAKKKLAEGKKAYERAYFAAGKKQRPKQPGCDD